MKRKKIVMCGIVLSAFAMTLTGCGKLQGKDASQIEQGNITLGISVHDPSVVKEGGKYYIFGSHMEAAESNDLKTWKSFASGVNGKNPLFDNLFDDEMKAFAYVGEYVEGGYAVWAPDVVFNKAMGKWVMYFSTSHDWRTSNICFAVADNITGPYSYVDTLLYSGFTSKTVDNTNFKDIMGEDIKVSNYLQSAEYNHLSYPNCIDPTVFYDEEGTMWMVYGSWSGGIWLLQIDEQTGYPIHPEANEETHTDAYFGQYLIGGLHNSCEGPYIFFDDETGYYYLLVSYGGLTRDGGYQIRCFRSEQVGGPYLDASGSTFGYTADHSALGVKMMGNYLLPSLKTAYMAPGHCSAMIDEDGKRYLVYHQRFNNGSEYHEPRVHQMFLNKAGWLVAAPFATNGESQKEGGYTGKEVEGKWYMLSHGTDIGADVHEGKAVIFKGGTISGDESFAGSYTLEKGTCYMSIVLNDITYDGVILDMTDEAGNAVRCYMAVGTNNETVWAVMYL